MTKKELEEFFIPVEGCVNRNVDIFYDGSCWYAIVTEFVDDSLSGPVKIVHQASGSGDEIEEAISNAVDEWCRTRCGAV